MLLSKARQLMISVPFVLIVANPIECFEVTEDSKYHDNYKKLVYSYVLLTSDVQEHYQASNVVIMHSAYDNNINISIDFFVSTLMTGLVRKFSSKFVLSLALEFHEVLNYFHSRIDRPLLVVFLNTTSEFAEFRHVTMSFNISFPFWLVIFTQPELRMCYKPENNYFNLAFDTEMMVKCSDDSTLREWYSIDGDNVKVDDIATWDFVNRFKLKTSKSLYQRRNSLGGRELRVATVKKSPLLQSQNTSEFVFCMEILDELSTTLNFKKKIVHMEEIYGMYNESTGNWSGVIGRVYRRDADIGVAEFTMTGERLNFVDFTLPMMLSRNFLYMRQPEGSDFQWLAHFRVFEMDCLTAVVGFNILSWFVITWINVRVLIRKKPIPLNHLSENFIFHWGIMCQQAMPDFPTATSLRIAYFTILLDGFFYMAVYSAVLISYLTNATPSLPFSTIEEFAQDGTYKLITFQESADYTFFASSEGEVLRQLMNMMLDKEDLPTSTTAGFNQICKSQIAFYVTEVMKTQFSSSSPCDLVQIETGRIDSLAMLLSKNSQYKGIINHHLQKFKDVGIMNVLQFRAYAKVTPPDSKFNPVNVSNMVSLIVIIGIGVILSIIMLVYEILRHRSGKEMTTRRSR